MKQVFRWQRILILVMLSITVLAPLVFVSRRLKTLTFVGVEVAERFAYYGIACNLITFLTGPLGQSVATAAENVNAWAGVSLLMPLLGAFVADSFLGRYRTVLYSSLLYILGLSLLALSALLLSRTASDCQNTDETASCSTQFQVIFFFFALYLLAVAQGGHRPCVQAFGADQFDEEDPEECKAKSSFFNWWYFGIAGGVLVSQLILSYIQDNLSWVLGFGIPCVVMVMALLVFLLGTEIYRFSTKRDEENPLTYRIHGIKLNAIEQEAGEGFKEPRRIVYEDKDFKSAVSDSSNENNEQSKSAEDTTKRLDENGTNHEKKEEMQVQPKTVLSKSSEKDESNSKRVQPNWNAQTRRRLTDGKIKELKDQLIRAKAYLHMTPPGSNSQLVKELKQRSKEVERVLGEANKDTDLSRSASQKMKALEVSLWKASRIYPECSAMAAKLRAMTYNAEDQVYLQKNQADYLTQLAGRTTPKGLHCLSMRLTSDYFALPLEQREFNNQENLNDPDFHHYAVFSDNVLACAVVVNSTVSNSMEPEKIVFHVVTDSLNFPAISMWFLLNLPGKATIHIQSIYGFGWLSTKYNSTLKKKNSHDPRYISALNHLRFYLPDVFPGLEKIVLFDHDVVVQRDLSRLWKVNMHGKVIGAVETCEESDPSFHRMRMFINFSDPFVAERFDDKACTWAFGMNLFDLQRWRKRNLTAVYHRYLHLGEKTRLWKAGSLPLGWMTFYNHTIALHKRWHVLGLGYDSGTRQDIVKKGAVIHYDGVMKPWLDIGIRKYKAYWSKHVNFDVPLFRQCNIHE